LREGLRFRQQEHLKRRAEITRVFKKGRIVTCSGAKLFFLENGLSHNRVVFTFARNYGNAVERNRAKRLGREAYRLMSPLLKGGFDLVLLMYRSEDTLIARQSQLKTLISKAGLGIRGKW
jgi:ribonuclease P protein component